MVRRHPEDEGGGDWASHAGKSIFRPQPTSRQDEQLTISFSFDWQENIDKFIKSAKRYFRCFQKVSSFDLRQNGVAPDMRNASSVFLISLYVCEQSAKAHAAANILPHAMGIRSRVSPGIEPSFVHQKLINEHQYREDVL